MLANNDEIKNKKLKNHKLVCVRLDFPRSVRVHCWHVPTRRVYSRDDLPILIYTARVVDKDATDQRTDDSAEK